MALASERVLKKGSSLETIKKQIDTINSALVAVGGTERNKNNSLYENLTVNELGIRTVLNKLEPRSVVLGNAAGIDVSDGSVGATILTRNGVVYSATNVQVGFYNMADGVKITIEGMEDSTADVFAPTRGKEQFPVDVAWGVSATGKRISVELQSPKNAKGGVEKQHSETIQSVTWAVDDISVAKVASSTAASTKITALKPGTTRLTVSVTTQQGNTYTDEIVINADIPTVSFTVEGDGTYTLTAVYTNAIAVANQETPVSYAWSINSSSAELNGNDATATLIGLEAGKVKATLKVTTDKEHEYMYTTEIDVVKN